tara:strand:+ start:370 stop:603 length:234 start_codon:yes stop_codon:yes gene_type:complete
VVICITDETNRKGKRKKMNQRKIQAVINRLKDSIKAKQNNKKLNIYSEQLTEDFYNGAIYGLEEAISKLEMVKESIK